jgi:flagellar biosynthetic protein FliR
MSAATTPIDWLLSSLLLSLRVAPTFAFAPPFSLVPAPVLLRVFLGVGIAASLVSAYPAAASVGSTDVGAIVQTAARELLLGSVFVLGLQLAFGGLYLAGRTIDVQAGFGLAMLIDPTTSAQTPLVGTLFAYAAAAVFFGMNGPLELLHILAQSLQAIPLGAGEAPPMLSALMDFMSAIFLLAFGVAGGVIVCLFLADLAIAMMSRTVPQMNVLILGFQAKTLIMLIVLPVALGASGALLARMMRLTLEAIPRML